MEEPGNVLIDDETVSVLIIRPMFKLLVTMMHDKEISPVRYSEGIFCIHSYGIHVVGLWTKKFCILLVCWTAPLH